MTASPSTDEPDDSPIPKRKNRGGKAVKATGKKPTKRLDKMARGGGTDSWVQSATANKGGLHRSLGIPAGEKISAKKIIKATHSSNPKIKKEAVLAETLKGFHKK